MTTAKQEKICVTFECQYSDFPQIILALSGEMPNLSNFKAESCSNQKKNGAAVAASLLHSADAPAAVIVEERGRRKPKEHDTRVTTKARTFYKDSRVAKVILSFMAHAEGKPVKVKDIMAELERFEFSPSSASPSLSLMRAAGMIEKIDAQTYKMVPEKAAQYIGKES